MSETIAVTGTGSASGPPDLAVIIVGVEVMAQSVGEARERAGTDIGNVLGSLRDNGFGERDLATTSYSISPEYDHREVGKLLGYRASTTVEARTGRLDDLGSIMDSAARAGSDNVVMHGLRFSHKNDAELAAVARAAAWHDAQAKATQLAVLAGVPLGPVVAMTEQPRHGVTPMRAAMAREATAATPIESGELSVAVNLHVEFSIGPAPE